MFLNVPKTDLQHCTALANNSRLVVIRVVEAQLKVEPHAPPQLGAEVQLETAVKYEVVSAGITGRNLSAHLRFEVSARVEGSKQKIVSLLSHWLLDYEVHPELPAAELSTSAVGSFCKSSAIMNAWPFWREYAQSSLSRAGMPFFTLPLLTLRASDGKTSNSPAQLKTKVKTRISRKALSE